MLKKRKDGSLSLVLPVWFRLIFLFIVILLSAGVFVSDTGARGQWIPFLIILVCIAGTLYEEKWIFNKTTGEIVYIFGLFFINKKTEYKLEETELFKISGDFHTIDEGRLNRIRKKMIKLSVVLKNGQTVDIDITAGRTNSTELKEKAEKIASYCNKELLINN